MPTREGVSRDQNYDGLNDSWPNPGDPITWPAHGRLTGLRGMNTLYGDGSVRWLDGRRGCWWGDNWTGGMRWCLPYADQ